MNAEVFVTLSIAGLIIAIGSLSSYLFKKTGIPDMVFLIGFGMLMGPFLNIVSKEEVIGVAPILAVLALLIILFDGGLNLDIPEIFSNAPRALFLAILSFVMNVVLVTFLARVFLGLNVIYGALLGSIIGGGSSIVVVSLAQRIAVSDKTRVILMIESTITDVLCTVAALALIHILTVGSIEYFDIGKDIVAKFTTGSFVGALIGIFWLNMLRRIKREPYQYMLTLALVLLGYVAAENIGGSGALSALTFGVILGNEKGIMTLIRRTTSPMVFDSKMRHLEDEIVFLIKSFFFVYLGLIISIYNIAYALFGLAISIILLVIRYIAVSITTFRSELKEEKGPMSFMYARGLAAAVLATLTFELKISLSDLFVNVAFVVILLTGIICSLGIYRFSKSSPKSNR